MPVSSLPPTTARSQLGNVKILFSLVSYCIPSSVLFWSSLLKWTKFCVSAEPLQRGNLECGQCSLHSSCLLNFSLRENTENSFNNRLCIPKSYPTNFARNILPISLIFSTAYFCFCFLFTRTLSQFSSLLQLCALPQPAVTAVRVIKGFVGTSAFNFDSPHGCKTLMRSRPVVWTEAFLYLLQFLFSHISWI